LADHGTHRYELWKSDGTESETVMVKDIRFRTRSNPGRLTDVAGTLRHDAEAPRPRED
jgi:ELWxxDGT repeat protein